MTDTFRIRRANPDPEVAEAATDVLLDRADVQLHRARLFRDKDELAKARALIEKHGYWRRKEELEVAEAALA